MRIAKDTVVSLHYELTDSSGNLIEKTDEPISYLHGGYDGIFPMVEEALHEKEVGFSCTVSMEPEHTFGEYDSTLIRMESRSAFPENVEVGMRFEGAAEDSDDYLIYTVTDIADDKVVVDGNHPLAGMALNFTCTVTGIRPATEEEISHQHVHSPGEHLH